jgi:uncharacterized protein (DUF924 family)
MWPDDVLKFWFEDLRPDDWFDKNPELDVRIRGRFEALHAQVLGGLIDIPETPKGHLAAIIVLDQFSRNLFRGSPAAFAADPKALALSKRAIERGFDSRLDKAERQFLYMPFMHSEDPLVQGRCVELFESLNDPVLVGFATAHRDIVERFGRFPHRNAALGRVSTPEEIEFMRQHAGF